MATEPPGDNGDSGDSAGKAAPPAGPDDHAGAIAIASGHATAVAPESGPRHKRLSTAAREALGDGVTRLGDGVTKLGEGVTKLGDLSRNVPVVGSSVTRLGEGLSHVGESLHDLPKVAGTRRGRLLIRSAVVGFVLVAAWIVVIVGLQLHGNDTPDFRPYAEQILAELSKGPIDDVYEKSSPRLQEMARKERFIDDMKDLAQTVGPFREITAVNDSLVTGGGPTGRVGRVSLTVKYDKAICKVAVSLHYDHDRWKLLGIGVELPPELTISEAQRESRVKACDDPMDLKNCSVHQAADAILRQLKDGRASEVWDQATQVFQKTEPKDKFVELQREHLVALGNYRRIITVSEAKVIGGTDATFDTVAEFDKASGVRTVFGFYRRGERQPWKLSSFKIVLPAPRAAADATARPAPPPVTPPPSPPPPSHLPPRGSAVK